MDKLYQLAKGYTNRFPNGNDPYQITTRILEECGEVASEVNHFERSGIKALNALIQLAVYYNVEPELESSIDRSLEKMKAEGLL